MKNFQQNLLIVLSLALCSLCVWQWYEQTVQRNSIQTLNRMVYERDTAIQGDTNSIAMLNHQLDQMDASLMEMKAEAVTNEQVIASQNAEITRLPFSNESLTNEVAQYQQAMHTLESRLKQAYASINQQNEAISNLIAQRDRFVKKYNDEVKGRNRVVEKYNELAKQLEQRQDSNNHTQ